MSEERTIFLWPRHDVLHLVTPSLCQSGRNLSNSVIIEVCRQLCRVQTPDGQISFEQWLIIAKEHLKWNDWCIRLFWDMLHASIWSQLSDSTRVTIEDFVDIGHLVVFLSLHQITTNNRPSSPTKMYDSYWPSPDKEEECIPTSGGEYMSPKSSPRSPRKIGSPRMTSPKPRSPLLQVKHTRSSTYHLNSLKDRMMLMLRLLSGLETGFMDAESNSMLAARSGSFGDDADMSPRFNSSFANLEISLSQRSMSALGLVIGAGYSKTAEEPLDSIFPYWITAFNDPNSGGAQDRESFDFDFESSATPSFPGFPQPIIINSAGVIHCGNNKNSVAPSSPPPTPPSRLSKAKCASEVNDTMDTTSHYPVAIFTCSEVAEWMESRLAINECRYPIISQRGTGTTNGHNGPLKYEDEWVYSATVASPANPNVFLPGDLDCRFGEDDINAPPLCSYVSVGDVVGWKPQVVSRRQSTLIYVVTPEKSGEKDTLGNSGGSAGGTATASGLFGLSKLSIDANKPEMKRSVSDSSEPMTISPRVGDDGDVSFEESDDRRKPQLAKLESESLDDAPDGGIKRDLPPLYVQSCSGTNLYLLGAYSSVAVTSCVGCEIVIGAVYGVVRVVGCDKVRLTVACRKLVLINCSECTINVASVKPAVLIGENKALSIGPHNVNYRLLKSHLMTAGLEILTMPAKYSTSSNVSATNNWHVFYDVGTLLESPLTVNSPTGYAVDAAVTKNQPPPPSPPEAIARFTPPFSFLFVTVPVPLEARGFEVGNPIEIPPVYYRSLLNRRKKLSSLQRGVIDFAAGTSPETTSSLQSTLSHRFLEWLAKNGRAQQVMDLISMDDPPKSGL